MQASDCITGDALEKTLANASLATPLNGVTCDQLLQTACSILEAIRTAENNGMPLDIRDKILVAMLGHLRDAQPVIKEQLKNIQRNAARHPRPWDLLAEVCAAAASGEYTPNNQYLTLGEAERTRIDTYLESGPGLPQVWDDAWHRRARLLGLNVEIAP